MLGSSTTRYAKSSVECKDYSTHRTIGEQELTECELVRQLEFSQLKRAACRWLPKRPNTSTGQRRTSMRFRGGNRRQDRSQSWVHAQAVCLSDADSWATESIKRSPTTLRNKATEQTFARRLSPAQALSDKPSDRRKRIQNQSFEARKQRRQMRRLRDLRSCMGKRLVG